MRHLIIFLFLLFVLRAQACSQECTQDTTEVSYPVEEQESLAEEVQQQNTGGGSSSGEQEAPPGIIQSQSHNTSLLIPNITANEQLHITRKPTVPTGIGGVILIATGLELVFGGVRAKTPTLFLGGFYMFAILMFITLFQVDETIQNLGNNREWIYLVIPILAGGAGGLVAIKWIKVGCVFLGSFIGYCLSHIFILVGLGTVLYSRVGYAAFIIIMTLITLGLVFAAEHPIKVIGSATLGAFNIMNGIDIYVCTGFSDVLVLAMNGHAYFPGQVPPASWGILSAILVLIIFGFVIQTMPQIPRAKKPDPSQPAWRFWPWQLVTNKPGQVPDEPDNWI